MALQSIKRTRFHGGISHVGQKVGQESSARFIKGMNPFEDPSYITLSRKATEVSSGDITLNGTVLSAESGAPWTTNKYFYDEQGKIHQETSGGTWSTLRTVTNGSGDGLLVTDNALFYTVSNNIGRYYPLDNSPSFDDDVASWWITSQLQTSGGGTGATDYQPPTSISEAATARQTFVAEKDPIESITIDVDVVGTGDWTVTVHNANNDTIGSATIANGSMSTGDVTFTFTAPLRVKTGENYHFHVTSTVADGGVDTDTNSSLEGAEYTVQYVPLVNEEHTMIEFLNGFAFGNERYIGYFDFATYEPNKIELAPGFVVHSLTKTDEFLIAAAYRGQVARTGSEARLYFWDGIQPTFNFFTEVKQGVPLAISNYKNELFGVYGTRGSIYRGTENLEEVIDEVPKLGRGKVVEVYPGAIDVYEGKLVWGVAGYSDDSTSLEFGIYQYGNQTDQLEPAFNMPFITSNGTTTGSNLEIGMVKAFGNDLYFSWRNGSTYGVDKISAGDGALASGAVFEDRIFDAGSPNDNKQAIKVEIEFEPLTTGQSVTPKYKLDRASSFTTGDTQSTVGATSASVFINNVFREAEWGFNVASSSNTFPIITAMTFFYDSLEGEEVSV